MVVCLSLIDCAMLYELLLCVWACVRLRMCVFLLFDVLVRVAVIHCVMLYGCFVWLCVCVCLCV